MTPEAELPITSSTKQQVQKPLYRTNNSSTSRPFASSASKRSSVQALTSIEYLQHNYSKMGLQNSNINSFGPSSNLMEEPEEMDDKENERKAPPSQGDNSSSSNAGIMRKKINRGLRISSSTNQQEQQFQLNLPPTPTKPNMIRKLPWELKGNKLKEKKNVPSIKEIKLEIVDALNLVIDKWSLVYPLSSSSRVGSTISHQFESSDTSNKSTSVNSSTSSDIGVNFLKDLISSTTKAIRAIQHSIISLPPSLSPLDLFPSSTPSFSSNTNNNQNLRQLTLVVLGTIQSLRDTYRLQPASTSSNSSMMQGKGRATSTYDFSDDEKESENDEEDEEDIEQGIEYRNDITLEDLRSEKEIIREYVEVVDRILLRAVEKKKVTKVAGSDVVSTDSGLLIAEGNESEGLDKDFGEVEGNFLPIWARDGEFDNDLESILDGTLLCLAYNSVLRDSTRPFGFIPDGSIHRLEPPATSSKSATTSTGDKKVGSTFRKVENLRMFAGALKFRYLINLTTLLSNGFDAKKIARKEEGWEEMLQGTILAWMKIVVEEKRAEEFE